MSARTEHPVIIFYIGELRTWPKKYLVAVNASFKRVTRKEPSIARSLTQTSTRGSPTAEILCD